MLKTRAKTALNRCLRPFNLEMRTLTADRREEMRLRTLESGGYFEREIPTVAGRLHSSMRDEVAAGIERNLDVFRTWGNAANNRFGIALTNEYFTSPDAETAYSIVQCLRPRRIVEVGSGHSTRVLRAALDGIGGGGDLVSIDPSPRREIHGIADKVLLSPVESIERSGLVGLLSENDILFIDSSHEVAFGNDVVFLYGEVLPLLCPGVVVHIHDVFLPFHYPKQWILEQRWPWTEQYLILMVLLFSDAFDVLWAGAHLQRTWSTFAELFPHSTLRDGSSLWLRKRS